MQSTCDQQYLRLELKYCEGCGGLWLRPTGSTVPYCRACDRRLAELAPARHSVLVQRRPM
jgi:hypothetical protein